MSIRRQVWSSTETNAEVTVLTDGKVAELRVKQPSIGDGGRQLHIFCLDVSYSMFRQHLLPASSGGGTTTRFAQLAASCEKICDKLRERGNLIEVVLWGNHSSITDYSTKFADAKSATIARMADENWLSTQPLTDRSFLDIRMDKWALYTIPRRGLERMEEIMLERKAMTDADNKISGVTIWISGDGEFTDCSITPESDLTSEFMTQYSEMLTELNFPIKLNYIGIINENVPDVKKIISLFPVSNYKYATLLTDIDEIMTKLYEADSIVPHDRVKVSIDGKELTVIIPPQGRLLTLTNDSGAPASERKIVLLNCGADRLKLTSDGEITSSMSPFVTHRQTIWLLYRRCLQLAAHANRIGDIDDGKHDTAAAKKMMIQSFTDLDSKIKQTLREINAVRVIGSEKNELRNRLYEVAKLKNNLIKLVAECVQSEFKDRLRLAQESDLLTDQLGGNVSETAAKFITRNSAKMFDHEISWKQMRMHHGAVVSLADDYVFTVTVAPTSGAKTKCESVAEFPRAMEFDCVSQIVVACAEGYVSGPSPVVVKCDEAKEAELKKKNHASSDWWSSFKRANLVYTSICPAEQVEDKGIDLYSADTWQEVYMSPDGPDTKCYGFLLPKKPDQRKLHTPSQIKIESTNTELSFRTLLRNTEERVKVDGYDSLFTRPFVGSTAEEKLNFGLPVGPYLEYFCRFELDKLLGYVYCGHELAAPTRWPDIYVAAVDSLLKELTVSYPVGTVSTKRLQDCLSLASAFVKIRKHLKMPNIHLASLPAGKEVKDTRDAKDAKSDSSIMKLIEDGDLGTHSFPNITEVLIWILDEARKFSKVDKAVMSTSDALAFDVKLQKLYPLIHREILIRGLRYADKSLSELFDKVIPEMKREMKLHPLTVEEQLKSVAAEFKKLPLSAATETEIRRVILDPSSTKENIKKLNFVFALAKTTAYQTTFKGRNITPQEMTDLKNRLSVSQDTDSKSAESSMSKTDECYYYLCIGALMHEFPLNKKRNKLCKSDQDIFTTLVKTRMIRDMAEDEKDEIYRDRQDSQSGLAHRSYPLSVSYEKLGHLHELIRKADRKEFADGVMGLFANQLNYEIKTLAVRADAVRDNLCRVYDKLYANGTVGAQHHRSAGKSLIIELSINGLFKNRCGHLLCEKFLQYDSDIQSHFGPVEGSDLPAKHKYRSWVPDFHKVMQANIRNSLPTYLTNVRKHCAQYIDDDILNRSGGMMDYAKAYYGWK
jgi:hypothetical protein